MTQQDRDVQGAKKPLPKRKSKAWPKTMKVIRRVHLYSGLMLLPWVLLYGVTAFLFNHPTVATDRTRRPLTPQELEGSPFGVPLDAGSIADVVAAALTEALADSASEAREAMEETDKPGGGTLEAVADVIPPQLTVTNPRFTRTARLEVRGEGLRQSFSYDAEQGSVFYSTRPFTETEDSPLDQGNLRSKALSQIAPSDQWKEKARELAERVGPVDVVDADVSFRSGPTLAFDVTHDGVAYDARYDLSRGSLSATEKSEARGMSARNFLLRLHLAHTYPSGGGIRWLWAILVDAMAFSMVAWAISGLFMWWQIKRTRGVGVWMVALSLVAAGAVGAVMYAEIIA